MTKNLFRENNGGYGKAIGDKNREEVRKCLVDYPGIRNQEITDKIGLSVYSVGRHVNAIRKEWL